MQVFDVIKYSGDNDTFVWKFPGEDFNTLSQLIVAESQEALFFKDGKAFVWNVEIKLSDGVNYRGNEKNILPFLRSGNAGQR